LFEDLGLTPQATAVDAFLFVDTNYSTTFRTFPPVLLSGGEYLEPKLFYALEILYHAHAVFRPVAFIQLPKSSAGEPVTDETEFWFVIFHLVAVFYAALDTILRLVDVVAVAARATLLLSEMADTKTAVHPAGGNHQ
jgi:hypothetical protein